MKRSTVLTEKNRGTWATVFAGLILLPPGPERFEAPLGCGTGGIPGGSRTNVGKTVFAMPNTCGSSIWTSLRRPEKT